MDDEKEGRQTPMMKEVPGLPGYRADDAGEVWSCRRRNRTGTWKKLKQTTTRNGYKRLAVRRGGKMYRFLVHRLVLLAFVGPCPPGMQCRHLDGDRANNVLTNLRWGTPLENAEDRLRHGTTCPGERNGKAKLAESQVSAVLKWLKAGYKQAVVAKWFGVSQNAVSHIALGKTWRHLKPEAEEVPECAGSESVVSGESPGTYDRDGTESKSKV